MTKISTEKSRQPAREVASRVLITLWASRRGHFVTAPRPTPTPRGCGPAVVLGQPSSRGLGAPTAPTGTRPGGCCHAPAPERTALEGYRRWLQTTQGTRFSSKFYRTRSVSGSIPLLTCPYVVYSGEKRFNLRRAERAQPAKGSH